MTHAPAAVAPSGDPLSPVAIASACGPPSTGSPVSLPWPEDPPPSTLAPGAPLSVGSGPPLASADAGVRAFVDPQPISAPPSRTRSGVAERRRGLMRFPGAGREDELCD